MTNLLFVYGTLKAGCKNHGELPRGAELLGKTSVKGWDMWSVDGYYPAITPGNGVVQGEIYQVHASDWPLLDEFEGVHKLYKRQIVHADNGLDVQVYVWANPWGVDLQRIEGGVWQEK